MRNLLIGLMKIVGSLGVTGLMFIVFLSITVVGVVDMLIKLRIWGRSVWQPDTMLCVDGFAVVFGAVMVIMYAVGRVRK